MNITINEHSYQSCLYGEYINIKTPTMQQFGIKEQDIIEYEKYNKKFNSKDDRALSISMIITYACSCLVFLYINLSPLMVKSETSTLHLIINIIFSFLLGFLALVLIGWIIITPLSYIIKLFLADPIVPQKFNDVKKYLHAELTFQNNKCDIERKHLGIKDLNYDIELYGAMCISKIVEDIQKFIAYRNNENLKIYKQREQDYWSQLDPYEFENVIASLFERQGYEATVTQKSGDGGKDIIIKKDSYTAYVQCKRFTTSKVDRPTLQQLYGTVMADKVNEGIIACLLGLTSEAAAFAKKVKIKVITIDDLISQANYIQCKELLSIKPIFVSNRWCRIGDIMLNTDSYCNLTDVKTESNEFTYNYRNLFFKIATSENIFTQFIEWQNKNNIHTYPRKVYNSQKRYKKHYM